MNASESWVEFLDLLTRGQEAEAAAILRTMDAEPWLLPLAAELTRRASRSGSARSSVDPPPDEPGIREQVDSVLDGDDRRAAAALVASVEGHGEPLTVAVARTCAGERLRRAGDRRAAREHLRGALEVFVAVGAAPWVRRVEQELRASGATLRTRPEEQELTPSEHRVAAMVADGRSNKEVAAALFLSPKTVEFHLSRAYRKLGVANRTALARALQEGSTSS